MIEPTVVNAWAPVAAWVHIACADDVVARRTAPRSARRGGAQRAADLMEVVQGLGVGAP